MASVREARHRPWVLKLHANIKRLCGRQEGVHIGDNPPRPGRPSHVLHPFWAGNLRDALNAMLNAGKQHTPGNAKAAMARLRGELADTAPAVARCDCGDSKEASLDVCEQRDLHYLLRLRRTANVKRLF